MRRCARFHFTGFVAFALCLLMAGIASIGQTQLWGARCRIVDRVQHRNRPIDLPGVYLTVDPQMKMAR